MSRSVAAAAEAAVLAPCSRCHQALPSVFTSLSSGCRGCQIITPAELALHKTLAQRIWLCISGVVYDVTPFALTHPGGLLPLLDTAGADCTDVFKVFHTKEIMEQRLPAFKIGLMGEVEPNTGKIINRNAWQETPMQAVRKSNTFFVVVVAHRPAPPARRSASHVSVCVCVCLCLVLFVAQDFHEMIRQMEADGLYVTNFAWYWMKVGVLATLFLGSMFCLALARARQADPTGSNAWLYLLSSLLLGGFWQQLAFMGHDLGHNAVRGSAQKDWLSGFLVTVLFGVSVQWWKRSHNVHHVVTNSLEHDPDIQYLPVFAFSEKMLNGFWSSYHEKFFPFNTVASWIIRVQHLLYWPVMGIARFNLYVQSVMLVWNDAKFVPYRLSEKLALLAFWAWHLSVLWLLPDWATRVWFVALSHNVAGLTHVQITLSHFAMPIHTEHYGASSGAQSREHFLRSQFATTMDVTCAEWMDWLHGGLQFQLTHHLLPRVPRHNLRKARELYVKPFAARHGLDYQQETFWQANVTVSRKQHDQQQTARIETFESSDSRFLLRFLSVYSSGVPTHEMRC